MIPSSLPVIVATAALTLLAAVVLLWAWRRGFLHDLDAQSRIIFEPRDWRLAPLAPVADAVQRQGLQDIVLARRGPGDI